MTVAPSANSCGAWLPGAIPAPSGLPQDAGWVSVFTDGAGDVAATHVVDSVVGWSAPENITFFPAGGGVPFDDRSLIDPIPQGEGFLYMSAPGGNCLVCGLGLVAWPSNGFLFTTDGYPWHGWCDWAAKPSGGLIASCQRVQFWDPSQLDGPPHLWTYDENLVPTHQSMDLAAEAMPIAADRAGAIVESTDAGQRWIDDDGAPVSNYFSADAKGSFALIGGGLLTSDGGVIASNSDRVSDAPEFLKSSGAKTIVLGERAYAVTTACSAKVFSASGESCGSVSVSDCKSLSFGRDGSAIASFDDGTWQIWSGLLR